LPGKSMSWSPATGPLLRVPRWRPASPPILPTSTRCGEERNRSTRVLIKTGSPASTSRTWSRPDTHWDELRRHRVPGRDLDHVLVHVDSSCITFMRLATSCSGNPPRMGTGAPPARAPDQYRRLTHAHAAATGVTRQGAPAPI